jgi:hypothetical protein
MLESIIKYWPVLVVFGSLISSWVAWSARRQFITYSDFSEHKKKTGERIGAVENKVVSLERDMAIIKKGMEHLPTKDDINQLKSEMKDDIGSVKLAVSNVNGEVKSLSVLVKSVDYITKTITKAALEADKNDT